MHLSRQLTRLSLCMRKVVSVCALSGILFVYFSFFLFFEIYQFPFVARFNVDTKGREVNSTQKEIGTKKKVCSPLEVSAALVREVADL